MPIFPLWIFEWIEATAFAQFVRDSTWIFPVTEAVHLLGLCAMGGALLIVDLRLLGVGLVRQSITELACEAHRWLVASVALQLMTGSVLFASEAVKCYHNPSFWVKMSALVVALTFTFAVRRPMAGSGTLETSWRSRLLAATSLGLWFTVAAAGRWIGFSS